MAYATIALIVGALLVLMALSGTVLRRLPLSTSIVYLAVGIVLGGEVSGLLTADFVAQSALFERVTEIAVVVSLFTAGLKLRAPLGDSRWQLPNRLAFVSMTVTVAAIAGLGVFFLHLPLGAAVLLGAVLAPTDPVLASDVQLAHVRDKDRLRFALTGEAGLNDGTAFPFVMLGLGLLHLHPIGDYWLRWLAVDVVWAVSGGLLIGAALGAVVGRLVVYLRSRHKEAVGRDEFLTLGLIALSYGTALLLQTYGFLAVFAAGHALRGIEWAKSGGAEPPSLPLRETGERPQEECVEPEHAPAYMTQVVLSFNEQLERIAEVALVLFVGVALKPQHLTIDVFWFVPVLLLLVRPLAVFIGIAGVPASGEQRGLIAWFGIRGIGSLYYLSFAVQHGLPGDLSERLAAITLMSVATSIVVHGVTVTPLMKLYEAKRGHGI